MDGVYSSKYFDYYADCIRAIPCADMDFNFADYCAVYHPSNGNSERFVNCMIENSEKQKKIIGIHARCPTWMASIFLL